MISADQLFALANPVPLPGWLLLALLRRAYVGYLPSSGLR